MNKNAELAITSPCISVCKTDPITGFCYGCGRSSQEKIDWKNVDIPNEWRIKNIEALRGRLTGWQQDAFNESYKNKIKTGKSLIMKKLANSKK